MFIRNQEFPNDTEPGIPQPLFCYGSRDGIAVNLMNVQITKTIVIAWIIIK